jgi:hypothetical protein
MRQYQFVQRAPDLLDLRVVPHNGFGPDAEEAIRKALAAVVPEVTVSIRRVSEILPERSGKYRIVQRLADAPLAPPG